jgi:hypothetical protein
MPLKRQKDQVNHCGKRLRAWFNKKCLNGAGKSGPDGQNLHFSNEKTQEQRYF